MGFFKKIFNKDNNGIPPAPEFPPRDENIDNSIPQAPDPFSNEIPAPNIEIPPDSFTEATPQEVPAMQEPPMMTEDPKSEQDDAEDFPEELEDPLSRPTEEKKPPMHDIPQEEDDYEYEPDRITEGPIFCKVNAYRDILEEIDHSINKAKTCAEISKRTNEIRQEEDKELERWKNILLDTYRKTHYIDKIIFEGEKR